MKFAVGIASLLIATGAAELASAYPTAGSDFSTQLEARENPGELSLRALFEVKRRAEEHAELVGRAYEELENKLYRRWGGGKYTIDDNTYHLKVKPEFLKQFKALRNFVAFCGNNPDFEINRDGTVYPSAVESKKKKDGKCTKKLFTLDLGAIVIANKPRERTLSPSPGGGRSPSPGRGRSPSPGRGRSPSPARGRSPSPGPGKGKREFIEIDGLD